MNYSEIRRQINYDIDRGVYSQFQWLKERLEYIVAKLTKIEHCQNIRLTRGEKNTLRENEYLK